MFLISPQKHVVGMVNVLKFQTLIPYFLAKILLFIQLLLRILSGMANSVDSDQTAPSGAV